MRPRERRSKCRLLLRRNNLFRYRTHPSLLIFTVIFTAQLRIYMVAIVDKSAKAPGHRFQFPRPIDERNLSHRVLMIALRHLEIGAVRVLLELLLLPA